MTKSTYEFGPAENKHFLRLANYCVVSALALLAFSLACGSFLFQVYASGKPALIVRTLDDLFLTLAALYAAHQLRKASISFRQIVHTQGSDITLLNLSNQQLRLVFASLAIMLISLAVRFVLDFPALMSWIKAA